MNKGEQENILKESIDELRRMHDEVCDSYVLTRNKVLAFLAGGLALLSYLYSSGDLFIPEQVYGKIFYFVGVAFCVTSIGILFSAMQAVSWSIPTDIKRHKNIKQKKYIEFLEYIKDEYTESLSKNFIHCENKQKLLNSAVALLIAGAILLLVIKNFNLEGGEKYDSSRRNTNRWSIITKDNYVPRALRGEKLDSFELQ